MYLCVSFTYLLVTSVAKKFCIPRNFPAMDLLVCNGGFEINHSLLSV